MADTPKRKQTPWRRPLAIIVCLALAAGHVLWPNLAIDGLAVSLVAAAAVLLLLPEPRVLLRYIKRVRIFDLEIELQEKIGQLSEDVEQAQEAQSKAPAAEVPERVMLTVDAIAEETAKDPRAALLLLGAKLEQAVRTRLKERDLDAGRRFMPVPKAVEAGVKAGIFPPEVLPAFRDFWAIRNQVAHGAAFAVQDSTVYSLVSLGTELLKIISAGETHG